MFSALAFVYISGVCAYVCVGLCECGYVRVLVRGLVTLSSIFQVVSQFTKKSCPCLQKQLPSRPGHPTPHLPHVLWTLPTEPAGSEERPEVSEVTTAVHGGIGCEWPPGVVWYAAWQQHCSKAQPGPALTQGCGIRAPASVDNKNSPSLNIEEAPIQEGKRSVFPHHSSCVRSRGFRKGLRLAGHSGSTEPGSR